MRANKLNSSRNAPTSSPCEAEKQAAMSSNDLERKKRSDNRDQQTVSKPPGILSHFSPMSTRSKSAPGMSDVDRDDRDHDTDTRVAESDFSEKDDSAISQVNQEQLFDSNQTKAVTASEILEAVRANGSVIQKVNTSVEKLHAAVFTLQIENDKMKKEIQKQKTKQDELYDELQTVRKRAELAEARANELEQYGRNYNVRIFHVQEPENETIDQCEDTVLKLLHDKLGLRHIQKKDFDAVHRIGQKKNEKNENINRSIIVRFMSRKTRNEVLANRRKLKQSHGRSITIVEDLTKQNYQLFCFARDASVTQKAWTTRGTTIIKAVNGKIKHIKQRCDLTDPSLQGDARHTAGQNGSQRERPPSKFAATHQNQSNGDPEHKRKDSDTRAGLFELDSEINSDHEIDSDREEETPAETLWN